MCVSICVCVCVYLREGRNVTQERLKSLLPHPKQGAVKNVIPIPVNSSEAPACTAKGVLVVVVLVVVVVGGGVQ